MRRALLVLLALALALAFLAGVRRPADPMLTIAGDGAPAVTAAHGGRAGGEAVASLEVVLLRRLENLRHLPEARTLCRDRCGEAATVFLTPHPSGLRKTLVLHLAAFDGATVIDSGAPLPGGIATCIAETITSEATARLPAPPSCLPSHRRRLALPWGL